MAAGCRSLGKSTLNCQPPVEKVTTFPLHKLPYSVPFVTRYLKKREKEPCAYMGIRFHRLFWMKNGPYPTWVEQKKKFFQKKIFFFFLKLWNTLGEAPVILKLITYESILQTLFLSNCQLGRRIHFQMDMSRE